MRVIGLALLTLLAACKSDRDSLGSFDENRKMTMLANCYAVDIEDYTSNAPEFRCRFNVRASDISPETLDCPCVGHATLHRAKNGTDAQLLQIQIDHCPHEAVASEISMHVNWLLTEKQLSQLKIDLEEPGRGAKPPALRADSGTISATRAYGDRVVDIDWSRDASRQKDGTLVPLPTESYFIAIRPRVSDVGMRVTSSKEPRVGSAPACH